MCCGGKGGRAIAAHEPHADCRDGRKDFNSVAYLIATKNGLDLCSIAGTGARGLVLREDVLRALGR